MNARTLIHKTPDGRRIEVSRELPVPAEQAWSLLTDTDRWSDWGPSVRAVECTDREIRAGSTGTIETVLAIRVPFEIVSCEPYRWTWRVARYVPVCRRALDRIAELAN